MLLFAFIAFWFSAPAQITISSFTFPELNDTLRYALDDAPGQLNANSDPGGNQIWDFTSVEVIEQFDVVFQAANKGMNFLTFPSANLVVIDGLAESYIRTTNNEVQVLGFAGSIDPGLGSNAIGRYTPPLIERRAPLNFFNINNYESNLSFALSTDDLPDSIFGGVPGAPDSIRFRINTEHLDVVDGWGKCIMPSGMEYDVLREKRTAVSTTAIDVFISFPFPIGWVDIETFLPGGGGLGTLLGADTTINYVFLSGTEKEEIAIAAYGADDTDLLSLQFILSGATSTDAAGFAPGKANVQAHPNPAVDWVTFKCSNLPDNDYTLKIFNIVGNVVWKESHHLTGNPTIKVDLEDFNKGTYLYSLEDADGNTVGTKRLVIIKP
jgi:hypothetical protein